jgi:hypothetical protein
MDIAAISWGDGLALTDTIMVDAFNTITEHAITRQDLAEGFTWGGDLDLDSSGILTARHLNGVVVWATEFLSGDDTEAIQAALDFLSATTQARGTLIIDPKPSGAPWDITGTINVSSGMTIIGHANTVILLQFGGAIFTIADAQSNIEFRGIVVDGDGREGEFVSITNTVTNVKIRDCQIGIAGDDTSWMNGYFLRATGTGPINNVLVEDCQIYNGGGIARVKCSSATHSTDLTFRNNRATNFVVGTPAASRVITYDLEKCSHVEIADDRAYGYIAAGNAGISQWLEVLTCAHFYVHGNHILATQNDLCHLDQLTFSQISDNTFLNAGFSGAGHACLDLDNCDDNVIKNNTASCVNDGVMSILTDYGIDIDASCAGNVITGNLFELLTNGTGPSGDYMCVIAGLREQATRGTGAINANLRTGNIYAIEQMKRQAIATATATFQVPAMGLPAAGDTARIAQYDQFYVTTIDDATGAAAYASDTEASNKPIGGTANEFKVIAEDGGFPGTGDVQVWADG